MIADRTLSVREDPMCDESVTNEGVCYDVNDDGCTDGCHCPPHRTSSVDQPGSYCDTSHGNLYSGVF